MTSGLSLSGVSWGPSPRRLLIEDISFEVPPGTITAIVGANGAGKSTLLRCIYRYYTPLAGTVLVNGCNLATLKPDAAARLIAVVLQEQVGEFPFSVREVIEMGRMPHSGSLFKNHERDAGIVEHALASLHLRHVADVAFHQLSGGEKQRVMLARALAQEPRIIVLDEPTNHLDIRHQLDLIAILRSLNMTIVLTMHDLSMAAEIADQIIVLQKGRILACGPARTALTPDTIRSAFDVDAQVLSHKTPAHTQRSIFTYSLPQGAVDNE